MLSTNYVQMIYHLFRPEQRRAHLSHRPDWPVKRWRLINTDRWCCEEAAPPIRARQPGLSSPPLTSIQGAAERHCCGSSAQNENKVLSQRRLVTLTEQKQSNNVFLISNHKHFNPSIIINGLGGCQIMMVLSAGMGHILGGDGLQVLPAVSKLVKDPRMI